MANQFLTLEQFAAETLDIFEKNIREAYKDEAKREPMIIGVDWVDNDGMARRLTRTIPMD